ncbi:MAG: aminoacyl-tRNA hydrolase [Candidatus Moraniibacteriota bacterium]|nr:MAG: aminoacyl-tRNA hydrolase [Candidatus Moranbacteria bacterium]
MYLIIGLGNPGTKYQETRHNAGFIFLDTYIQNWDFPKFSLHKNFSAETSEGFLLEKKILLAKPQTYMNLSGKSVKALIDYYKINLENILIIHDDKDLSLGEIRTTLESSSAGHRGVQNIFDILGTKAIKRIRIGIGPVQENVPTDAFVLGQFTSQEKKSLLDHTEKIQEIVFSFLEKKF